MKDTWYKRLGWFLLFSLITLGIFFIIDSGVQKLIRSLNDNEYVASFTALSYQYSLSDNEPLQLEITTDAKKYYYDLWIDDYNLEIKIENESQVTIDLSQYEMALTPGEHTIKASFFGKNGIAKYRESLITTKLIVTE